MGEFSPPGQKSKTVALRNGGDGEEIEEISRGGKHSETATRGAGERREEATDKDLIASGLRRFNGHNRAIWAGTDIEARVDVSRQLGEVAGREGEQQCGYDEGKVPEADH